jgi:hypothetical protein
LDQSCSVKVLSLPGEGPPALFTRMSGSGQAASTAARPLALAMSAATGVTCTLCFMAICSATSASRPAERAFSTRSTPSAASASAQARPSPLLAAQTMARRPRNPRSMRLLLYSTVTSL